VAVVSLGIASMPLRVHAGPAASPPTGADAAPDAADEPAPPRDAAPPADEGDGEPVATEDGPPPDEATAAEPATADDATADDATAPEEPAAEDTTPANGALGPTAAPLRPMQTAAWWTMFGAFAVGTTAGVLAGLAERQEDRATRLSTLFDAETGAQPLYADEQSEYEGYLRRGEGYAKAAIGVGVVAGVATIAAITLFAIDAKRQRGDAAPRSTKKERRAKLKLRGGGVEVRF
jgi:hypothetical protein